MHDYRVAIKPSERVSFCVSRAVISSSAALSPQSLLEREQVRKLDPSVSTRLLEGDPASFEELH